MTNKHKTASLLMVSGVLFLIASPQYAAVAHDCLPGSINEAITGLPALVFCWAGIAGVVSGVCFAIFGESK